MANSKPATAFLIHSCCWSLLIRHFANDEVDLDRLFEVCRNRSASRTAEGVHDFDSLWSSLQHPLIRPIIRGIGDDTKQLSKIQRLNIGASNSTFLGPDCFGRLPIEIRLEIAAYLSTADFLGLRLVSRAMVPVFSLQSFWRTRFRVNGDRGFLNCLTDDRGKQKNWRSIYHCTARIEQAYLHVWSVRRQWRNNCWLRDRYSMTQALSGQTEFEDNSLDEVAWKEAAAEIRCDRIPKRLWRDGFKCKCRQEEPIPVSHTALLHDLVIGMTVFILHEGTTRGRRSHIIGFDLISADAEIPNITLGHRLPGSQVTIDFYGRHLRGFGIVTGNSGIRALRPVFDSGTITSWIGDSEQDEMTMQLILKDDVKAISAKFDVSHFP
mgnify:FL=1|jgi:hypothetical protein